MPLTAKGEKIMANMQREYGPERGERVFYASRNAGRITGVDPGHQEGGAVNLRPSDADIQQALYGPGWERIQGSPENVRAQGYPTLPRVNPQRWDAMVAGWPRSQNIEDRRTWQLGMQHGGIINHELDSELPAARDDAMLIQMMPRTPPAYDATIARLVEAQRRLNAQRPLPPWGWIPMRAWNGGWVVPRYWAGGWVW